MSKHSFKFYAFKLTAILIVIFLAQILIPGFTEFFVLNAALAGEGEYWRFVSALFLHGGMGHLLYNGFALALFGSILERVTSGRKFLFTFFVTGILANIFSALFYTSSLGASGAIFGVIGALIFIRPLMTVWAFGLPMPLIVAGFFWGVGDFIGAVGFLAGNPIDNTGNLAHLSGMFFGLIFGYFFRSKKRRPAVDLGLAVSERDMRRWEDAYLK